MSIGTIEINVMKYDIKNRINYDKSVKSPIFDALIFLFSNNSIALYMYDSYKINIHFFQSHCFIFFK